MSDLDNKLELNNIEGLRVLKMTKLDYSRKIIEILRGNMSFFPILLEDLEVTKDDFFDYLLGNKEIDITFYDQTLVSLLEMVKHKKKELGK